jgi:hypothetical protein
MRYLLHHSDAAYDTATKAYTFTLDKRVANPRTVRINKCTYTAATAASYPSVVYVRSNALAAMAQIKHTVELKASDHENNSNVIAVLEQTLAGHYALKSKDIVIPVHGHTAHSRSFDFYFTDGPTVLDGGASASGGSGGSGSAVTDATIEAFTDPTIWLDLAPARTLTAAFATCSALGDLPKYLYSRSPTPAGLILAGNWDFELVNMKTGLLGISRDTDPSLGHGQALNDSSYPTNGWDQEFQVHHIFKSHSNYTQTAGLFKLNNNNCYVWIAGNGGVNFRNSSNQNVTLTNLSWIPNRVYIISIKRAYDTASSSYQFHWRMEDVELGTAVTEVSDAGAAVTSSEVGWSLGIQGMYYRHIGGPLIGANGILQTEYDNSITWLKNWYGETAASGGEEESSSSSVNATFFVELDVKRRNK